MVKKNEPLRFSGEMLLYDSEELTPQATIRKFRIVQTEGARQVSRNIEHYNLDRFLAFNDRDVLAGAGAISHKEAIIHAESEYKIYAANRRTLLEAEGERTSIEALEVAEKQIKWRKNET